MRTGFAAGLTSPLMKSALAVLLIGFAAGSVEAKIEAVKGKQYPLTERHGPWMIMVTSFEGTEKQDEARKAANQLVYKLRQNGIPAYTYEQDARVEKFTSNDLQGVSHRRVFAAQRPMVAVVAGNYSSVDEKDPSGAKARADAKLAQQTLDAIKAYAPRLKYEIPGTGEMSETAPLNLKKAFLTRNPLLGDPEEKVDPLIIDLNSGNEFSLLKNKGNFTLIVASFYGSSQIRPVHFNDFERRIKVKQPLEAAANDALDLATMLRKHPKIHELKLQPYVLHEQYRSIVTVGSFDSLNDPRIDQLREVFRAKYKRDNQTGQDVLVAEWVSVPGRNPNDPPVKSWLMDPEPKVLEVPKAPRS